MIFLSAGHSTVDSGATTTVKDVAGKSIVRKEADIAEEVRDLIAFYLQRGGVPYKADGVGHQNMTLAETVKIVGKNRPALEFHCNSVEDKRATGVETLSAPKDVALGQQICAAIAGVLGIPNRGAKPENAGHHHRLAFVRAGGIIVELFFLSNVNDLAAYDAKKWLLAKAIAEVLMKVKAA